MSCGSARYLSELMGGQTPGIDGEGLSIARYAA